MKGIPVVIIGTTRSGTKYMSKVFDRAGLHVGHEKFMRNGISSFALSAGYRLMGRKFMRGGSFRDLHKVYKVFRVVHLVRDPLKAISSMQTEDNFVTSIVEYDGRTPLFRTMKHWYQWNCMAEQLSVARFKVEEIPETFETILSLLGFRKKRRLINPYWFVNTQENTREGNYIPRSWDDLYGEDEHLADLIWAKAVQYGY